MDVGSLTHLLTDRGYDVVSLERLSGGASNHTFRVDTTDGVFALRWSPGTMDESEAIGLAEEARVMAAARASGVSVPEVIEEFADSGTVVGLLTEWVAGETIGSRIVRSDRFADVRGGLARQCGQQLARIHAVPVDEVSLRTLDARDLVEDTLGRYQAWATPQPMIDFAARWLLDHLPDRGEVRLVHGDFRCGNLMVDPDAGLVAVLDWELAHRGDPHRDLAWMLNRSWRFGAVDLEVGGFGRRDDFFDAYEAESGRTVDREAVRFWEVFGSFWWAVTCLGMVEVYRQGLDTSFERLVIGRRSSEAQADLVELLIPGPVWTVAAEPDAAAFPSSAEILDAVGGWLGGAEFTGQLDERTTFLARVARNAMAIAAREAEFGAAARAAEHERLEAIAGHEGDLDDLRWELIAGIESGEYADDERVHEHLRLSVADQLAIDQPGYRVFGE